MKVQVVHWVGGVLPPVRLSDDGETFEVSGEEIIKLFEMGYDVMLHHARPPVQTKKEIRMKGQLPDGTPLLALDDKYRRFAQR